MALHGTDALKVQPLDVWKKMENATALGYVPTTEFPGQFNHIMNGYQVGYYGYMWSEVMALDMLSAFGDNLNNPKVGQHYRQTILSQGSQNQQKSWSKISSDVNRTTKHFLMKLQVNE
jgi:thimet oligopeptidase